MIKYDKKSLRLMLTAIKHCNILYSGMNHESKFTSIVNSTTDVQRTILFVT